MEERIIELSGRSLHSGRCLTALDSRFPIEFLKAKQRSTSGETQIPNGSPLEQLVQTGNQGRFTTFMHAN
jgi:hypothetical protein